MAALNYFLAKRYYNFHLFPKNQKLLICTAIWAIFAFIAGTFVKMWFFSFIVTLLGLPWFYYSSKAHERDFLKAKLGVLRQLYTNFSDKYLRKFSKP